jgi:hypothetical protein
LIYSYLKSTYSLISCTKVSFHVIIEKKNLQIGQGLWEYSLRIEADACCEVETKELFIDGKVILEGKAEIVRAEDGMAMAE